MNDKVNHFFLDKSIGKLGIFGKINFSWKTNRLMQQKKALLKNTFKCRLIHFMSLKNKIQVAESTFTLHRYWP